MTAAGAPRLALAEGLYFCEACGARDLPLARMAKTRKRRTGVLYVSPRCLACERKRKRASERRSAGAPRAADGTLIEAVLASDPRPARLLADLLREDRDRWGFDFDACWAEDVAFVLRRVRNSERDAWREAFESQRSAWEAAWDNAPGPGWQLSPQLTDELATPD